MQNYLLLGLVFILVSCDNNSRLLSSVEVSEPQPPTEQGEVWGPAQMKEARLIRNQFKDILLESTGDSPIMKRDAHPKHHGCVAATLKINNQNLKDVNQVGLFAKNSSYKGVVRFSNGDPNHLKADKKSDVRGMSLKIFDVPYEHYLSLSKVEHASSVHDFVFMNSKEFFIKDPEHYGKFMSAVKGGGFSLAKFAAWAVLNPNDDFVSILSKAMRMRVESPLDINYHSATPYKLGPDSMKMKFKSCRTEKVQNSKFKGDNYLSKELMNSLDNKASCFDFYVQINKDTKRNDIENSQALWFEKQSPYLKVGRLNIPRQSKESILKNMETCENLSFNPWRAPIDNRPLGGINRIRLEVYIKQAKMRHNHNGIVYPGPDFFDIQ